jgi:hypothetical protein
MIRVCVACLRRPCSSSASRCTQCQTAWRNRHVTTTDAATRGVDPTDTPHHPIGKTESELHTGGEHRG